MKNWLVLLLALLVFSSLAYAQTVNTAELKTVLIDAIKDYLSSQTPKLTVNELKDLIVVYLTTSGGTVDLSKTGAYSGEKLIDIYNKAKGAACTGTCKDNACSTYTGCSPLTGTCASGNCCTGSCTTKASTGKWSAQIASATPIKDYGDKAGLYIIWDVPIQQGGTYYFLADPKGVGATHFSDVMTWGIRDTEQGATMRLQFPTLYKVDVDGNELGRYLGYGSGDYGVRAMDFTKAEYDKGVRFLFEIIEKGGGSGTASSVYWCPY